MFQGVNARFKMYLEDEAKTKPIDNTSNPDWNFKQQFNFTPATAQVRNVFNVSQIICR